MRAPDLTRLASPRATDVAVAAGLLAWGLPNVPWWWEHPGHASPVPDMLAALALTLAMSVPFCWRRRIPVMVLAAAAGVLAIRLAWHMDPISAFAAVLAGAYGLGAYASTSRRYARWLGWAALAAAVGTLQLRDGDRLAAVPFALLGAAFMLGDAASARRGETVAAVEAAHQAERTRIARELHDVVAHQLSAIAVQAGTARLLAATGGPGDGDRRAAEVLATVERLAREALTELGHLLGALRREPADDLTRPPTASLAELAALISATEAAGTSAELAVEGVARPLPAGLELSCYRIISEALANVVRHAPGAAARVVLTYQPDRLDIEVVNGPPAHRAHVSLSNARGLGIRGMRERAELYGGRFEAGARPGGGFAVTVTVPCPAAPGSVPPVAAEAGDGRS